MPRKPRQPPPPPTKPSRAKILTVLNKEPKPTKEKLIKETPPPPPPTAKKETKKKVGTNTTSEDKGLRKLPKAVLKQFCTHLFNNLPTGYNPYKCLSVDLERIDEFTLHAHYNIEKVPLLSLTKYKGASR